MRQHLSIAMLRLNHQLDFDQPTQIHMFIEKSNNGSQRLKMIEYCTHAHTCAIFSQMSAFSISGRSCCVDRTSSCNCDSMADMGYPSDTASLTAILIASNELPFIAFHIEDMTSNGT